VCSNLSIQWLGDRRVTTAVQTRYGTISMRDVTHPLCRALIEYGEWAQPHIELLLQLVGEGSIIVDAMAFVGAYTMPLARRVGTTGRVHVFEPSPTAALLAESLVHNGIGTAVVYNACLDAQVGLQPQVPGHGRDELRAASADKPRQPGVEMSSVRSDATDVSAVATLTLDALGLAHCTLIHLACDGAEWRAVVGGTALIRRTRPYVSIECVDVGATWTAASLLLALGYICLLHSWPAFNNDNFRHSRANMYGGLYQHSLLCVPAEKKGVHAELEATAVGDVSSVTELQDLVNAYGSRHGWSSLG
jgi:FkbM family methyltransferase